MKKTLLFIICLGFAGVLPRAQQDPYWLRYPAISPDGRTIVFTYKGDLYRVPATGGDAVPLTIHEAHDFMPVWNRDGTMIAFASDRYGNFDVFVMPASGGAARRITFHSSSEYPYEFNPDNTSVLFGAVRMDTAASRTFPTGYQPELYVVPVIGGRVEQLLTTPAEEIKLSRDGRYMVYEDRKGGENPWRKHHRSAIARDIWMYDRTANTHKKLTTFPGEDRNPVWTDGDRSLIYLSEQGGSFNVYRMSPGGGPSEQLTFFERHPVRFLSASTDGLMSFTYDGAIYTQKGKDKPQKVRVAIGTDVQANNEKVLAVNAGADDLAVSPNGKEVAFVFRGEVFVTSVDGEITKRITSTPESESGVQFSPDGNTLLYASERDNRWKIIECRRTRDEEPYFYASTILKETPLIDNAHENYQPRYSPDAKEIAYIEDRMTLKIFNIESQESRTLLTDRELFSMRDNDQYFRWSPDSKWILFDYAVPGIAPGEIGLIQADGKGQVINLTQSGFEDRRAKWILGGEAMIWFSNRDGLKSVAQSGSSQTDVYGLFFKQEAWDRYRLSKDEAALVKDIEERKKKEDSKENKEEGRDPAATVKDLSIDWDGLDLRKTKMTIHSSSLGDALVDKTGETLYYLARFEKGMNLWSTNLRTNETKMLVGLNANRASMEWDKDQKSIFLLADGAISKINPESGKRDTVKIKGEMILDVGAERQFMYDHVWRRTRSTFYTEGFHGADWDALKKDYEKFLPHIGNSHEFAEMLSEMLGELNVSHSGARYSSNRPDEDSTAALGVFLDPTYRGDGFRIDEVVQGGPLDKAGMNIVRGNILESIDGVAIRADMDLAQLLNRKADKRTLLVIRDGETTRQIVVTPITLGEENRLLYDRWVRRNREEVDRLSDGQLGYIHVPGMNDNAYRNTYEEVMGRFATRKGIVVDTRFNGGGDLVADLAMFLSGKRFFDYTTDTRSGGYEPNFRWTRPSISLANEANYSDGHCYAFTYQSLQLGKLVGMPVPGTCTFAGWERLQDSSIRWGVPPLGVKALAFGYLENRQTEPDIKVMNEFSLLALGRDQQLEAAVAELLKEIR